MKTLLAWCCLTMCVAGADYSGDYAALKKKVPADQMEAHLAHWRTSQPEDPDAWILSANWSFEQAQSESIAVTTEPAREGDLAVTDPKTGKTVGSLSTSTRADPERLKTATGLLREAAKRWPQRLDIHCGLAHMLEASGAWGEQLDAMRALLAAVREHPGKLRWCHGEPLDAPESAFVASKLHSYALHQFEKETPETDARFHTVAKLIVASFPDSALGYNDLAIFHGLKKNWRAVQTALEAAAKAAPEDALVWANLGDNSVRLSNAKRARTAYEKVIALNSDLRMVTHAQAGLAKLTEARPRKRSK